ncbi:glycosyltransferase family 2 protein [Pseudodonghicola flavimaris]|uniref:Glycosyltransferase family 2 protein n=1 Tax=Pseudodonghicola flavimaris TaxID=3050036 RepID=A0ABT7F534_9RHOB|nr:glycosyltransferase family 2 protein [Pseudodonghicola flavimaris]MDK3019712.1 glycosyltransferase family 2 protein [Pseudodonghicola flavimaris]
MTSLSLIVPFYDETAYLQSALNSILDQRIDGLQIIVVNDNPDRFSAADLARLGALRSQAELIQHPRNLGLSAARNSGLAAARGRYIGFLDADDYYTLGGLARQLRLAEETGADIVHAPTYFRPIGSARTEILPRDRSFFCVPKTAAGLQAAEEAQFITSSWSSLYARDFLTAQRLRFDPAQRKFEDRLFVLHTVTRARQIAFLGRPTRVWRGRAGSISVTAADPELHLLQLQLLEKCMAHMRAECAAGTLPPRFEKRELFNTLSRLIWDLDLIEAITEARDPAYADMARRIPALLGEASFGQSIFEDRILAPISRVGQKTQRGRITRAAFFQIHRALRAGDFAAARDQIAGCALPVTAPTPRPSRRTGRHGHPRLLLHLGLHKTGSTHIQHHLLQHRAALACAGILVPETGFQRPEAPLRRGATPGHHDLVAALRRGDDDLWDRLDREIASSGASTVLISCENMSFPLDAGRSSLIAALAERLKGFAEVRLLALARRPDAYVEALYRERIALGIRPGARGIGAFLVDHAAALTDWPGLFAPFEAGFGSSVALGDFDAMIAGDGLWPGFAALAGLPADLPALDLPRYAGPDRETVVLLQLLNTLVPDAALRAGLVRAWFALHPATGSDASLLPPEERQELLDLWQTQSQTFAAARGYAPDLSAAGAALSTELWAPPHSVPADALCDLIDLAQQAAEPLFALPQRTPSPPQRSAPRDLSLKIRLRPWAADLVRRLGLTG